MFLQWRSGFRFFNLSMVVRSKLQFLAILTFLFSHFGVSLFKIIYDRVTDRSRGFAFLTMGTVQESKEAIRMFDGSVSVFHICHDLHFFLCQFYP